MIQQKVWTYQDMDVFYCEAGNSQNAAIVFLHPAFGDHRLFMQQLAHFKEHYHVFAVDMVAHGKSQPGRKRVDMGDMPDIIAGLLDAAGVQKAHFVGVSLGSLVVQAMAYVYPQRILSVTIVGGYSIHKDNRHIQKAQHREMLRWVWYMLTSMKQFKKHVIDISASSEAGRAVFLQAIDIFTRRSFMYMGGMNRFFVDVDTPMPYPLLILCGEHDMPLALEAGQRLAQLEPDAQFAAIPNAGHCANIDNPQAFNVALETFFNS